MIIMTIKQSKQCLSRIHHITLQIKTMKISRKKFLSLLLGGSGSLFVYSVFIERTVVDINHYKIRIPNLPEAFNGFRIAHLTDIHYGNISSQKFLENIISTTHKLKPDAIVCTGDYADMEIAEIDEVWPLLSQLEAPNGVYSVLGNHDHYADTNRSLYWLERSGQGVRHISKPIENKGQRIWIGGAGDFYRDKDGVDKAFENVSPDEFKILLAHNPDTIDLNFNTKIDVAFSGHTHGGQVRIPGVGSPVLPVRNKRYDCGLIETESSKLFISKGIGWGILPVRFNCSPEIAVVELYC